MWRTLFVFGYAWQVHGWLIGLAFLSGHVFFDILISMRLHKKMLDDEDDDPERALKSIRIMRWINFGVFVILVGLSGMEQCGADLASCQRVFF